MRLCISATDFTTKRDYLETPRIFGTSPGSSMQYEIPLYVVPTSKASTNLRERPRYGSPDGMLWAHVGVSSLRDEK